MLFSAGMGIGLVFYGAAEPISHYAIQSPTGDTETAQAFRDSLRYTFSTGDFMHGRSMPLLRFALHTLNLEKMRLA